MPANQLWSISSRRSGRGDRQGYIGAMSTTAKVPEEPGLRHLAETLEASGAVAQLYDRKWRLVYSSSEVQRMMAPQTKRSPISWESPWQFGPSASSSLSGGSRTRSRREKSLRSWTSRSFATSFAWRERPISLGARRTRAVRRTRMYLHGHGRYLSASSALSEYSSTGGINADRERARVELMRSRPPQSCSGTRPSPSRGRRDG